MARRHNQRHYIQKRPKPVSGTIQTLERPLVSEIIGRATTPYKRLPVTWRKTVDETVPEYDFWSRLARGKEPGYELGALFAKRIAEIDAEWTLGRGFMVDTGDDDVDERVAQFVQDNLDTLMTWRKDANRLGDGYLIVNPDGSLALASPDTVEVLTDPLDYTAVIGYRITTTLETATVIDEYFLDRRVVTFQRVQGVALFGTQSVTTQQTFTFPNLIGMLPVIHLPNDREANEIYGHPMYEALLTLFARYDDVIQKSLDGVEIMGRPIPVAEGLPDPELAQEQNSTRTETVRDAEGVERTVPVVDFEDLTMLWLGEGATFKFAAPGSFSADSVAMLKKLFYLMLEHTGIPEWAWGGAVAGGIGGDSVASQMPAFIRYLEGRRTATQQAVVKLVLVWLAWRRLVEPLAQVERINPLWPELEQQNEEIQLKKIQQASLDSLVTKETELRLLDLVDDPASEVEAATAEAETEMEKEEARLDAEVARMKTMNEQPKEEA